jgi:hypothetical protein
MTENVKKIERNKKVFFQKLVSTLIVSIPLFQKLLCSKQPILNSTQTFLKPIVLVSNIALGSISHNFCTTLINSVP